MIINKICLKLIICAVCATIAAFVSHIYIQDYTKPIIDSLTKGLVSNNHEYPLYIKVASYITALFSLSVLSILYYNAGHLLAINNKLLKSLALTVLILEIKGDFIRGPLMNYIYNKGIGLDNSLLFVILSYADKWVPNLLIGFILVYFCPLKSKSI
jgi:hypothetical protein